jgi:hypothetical protein
MTTSVQRKQHALIAFLTAENMPPLDIHWQMEVVCGKESAVIIRLHIFMMGSLKRLPYWHNH